MSSTMRLSAAAERHTCSRLPRCSSRGHPLPMASASSPLDGNSRVEHRRRLAELPPAVEEEVGISLELGAGAAALGTHVCDAGDHPVIETIPVPVRVVETGGRVVTVGEGASVAAGGVEVVERGRAILHLRLARGRALRQGLAQVQAREWEVDGRVELLPVHLLRSLGTHARQQGATCPRKQDATFESKRARAAGGRHGGSTGHQGGGGPEGDPTESRPPRGRRAAGVRRAVSARGGQL
mmetsp:Transcript_5969/g.17432  ORF Transcript_5969/g.17432 Transcript_5969/m.17432 type:complete len:239 (-) Transcript_5969:107-823(-)